MAQKTKAPPLVCCPNCKSTDALQELRDANRDAATARAVNRAAAALRPGMLEEAVLMPEAP